MIPEGLFQRTALRLHSPRRGDGIETAALCPFLTTGDKARWMLAGQLTCLHTRPSRAHQFAAKICPRALGADVTTAIQDCTPHLNYRARATNLHPEIRMFRNCWFGREATWIESLQELCERSRTAPLCPSLTTGDKAGWMLAGQLYCLHTRPSRAHQFAAKICLRALRANVTTVIQDCTPHLNYGARATNLHPC